MGIAYKDLKAGKYYKGDHPSGSKMFIYVETTAPHHPPNQQVSSWEIQRTKGLPAGSPTPKWVYKPNQVLPGTQDSFMRREVTPQEVLNEGVPLVGSAPPPPRVAPSSTPAPVSRPSEVTGVRPPTLSAPPSKPPALRKDGTPKAAVQGNSTSKACLYCAKPNKTLVLFRGSTFWCPDCEP